MMPGTRKMGYASILPNIYRITRFLDVPGSFVSLDKKNIFKKARSFEFCSLDERLWEIVYP